MKSLVTKDLLKAFGDKSKLIFKPATATAVNDNIEKRFAVITTELEWLEPWDIHIDINGKGFLGDEYFGDIKFFCNVSNQGETWTGNGFTLVDNYINGLLFDSIGNGKVCFVIEFSKAIKDLSVDIINYTKEDTSNVIVSKIKFINGLGGGFSIQKNRILGAVEYNVGDIGTIYKLDYRNESNAFLIRLPADTDEGYSYVNVPITKQQIDTVYDSKWAQFLSSFYNIHFKGDVKDATVTIGGETLDGEVSLEIDNTVEGYIADTWFGKVKVNDKGLVTAVETEPELPIATDTVLGGIQVGFEAKPVDKKYPVELDENNNAYVHVPWNDTDTWNKVATESDLGLIKLGFEENAKKYPVELDSDNKAYVEVPWTDTIIEIPEASDTTSGTIKLGYEENGKNYPIELNEQGQAFVNVPWESSESVTYDIATAETAGLIKVGFNKSYWWENAVKVSSDGNAYVNIGTPVYKRTLNGSNITSEFSYGFNDYSYFLIDSSSTSSSTLNLVLRAINGWDFKGVLNIVYRISNQSQYPAIIKVSNNIDTTLCNMFDVQITSTSGLELPAGQTLELVFTFWDVNDVSFNGGFSV